MSGYKFPTWGKDNVEKLRVLWSNDKLSTSVIALRLGLNKNQVIGKAHRLKLKRRKNPVIKKQEW